MNEFERFSQHWQNAVNGLVGRMANSEKALYTQKEINELWQEELVENRFLSFQNEAGNYLKDLRQRDHDTARQVEDLLWDSRLDVGMAPELCAMKALGAAAAFSLSAARGSRSVLRLMFGTVGMVLAGTTACDVAAASKGQLMKQVAAAAQEQLEAFRPVLEP